MFYIIYFICIDIWCVVICHIHWIAIRVCNFIYVLIEMKWFIQIIIISRHIHTVQTNTTQIWLLYGIDYSIDSNSISIVAAVSAVSAAES